MAIVGHVLIVSKYLKHIVFRVTKCVDLDSGFKLKILTTNLYLTLAPPSEISRTAVD
jgi:hypothetical protein